MFGLHSGPTVVLRASGRGSVFVDANPTGKRAGQSEKGCYFGGDKCRGVRRRIPPSGIPTSRERTHGWGASAGAGPSRAQLRENLLLRGGAATVARFDRDFHCFPGVAYTPAPASFPFLRANGNGLTTHYHNYALRIRAVPSPGLRTNGPRAK